MRISEKLTCWRNVDNAHEFVLIHLASKVITCVSVMGSCTVHGRIIKLINAGFVIPKNITVKAYGKTTWFRFFKYRDILNISGADINSELVVLSTTLFVLDEFHDVVY